jgi:hypothetical protein
MAPWWTTGGGSRKAHRSSRTRPLRWVGAHHGMPRREGRAGGSSPVVAHGGGGVEMAEQ